MALIIRLNRYGKKNRPAYRIAVAEKRSKKDGKVVEYIGQYDPLVQKTDVSVDIVRFNYWIEQGAHPSKTVAGLVKKYHG